MTEKIRNPILKGRGGRDVTNGATAEGDDFIHLASVFDGCLCGKAIKGFLLTYDDVEITCPKCIEKILRKK